MIGSLVRYNCGESKAIGIVTDIFRYEAPTRRRMINKNSLVISIEWVIKDPEVMPQSLNPRIQPAGDENRDDTYWPVDWHTKEWYSANWFKVVSDVPRKY